METYPLDLDAGQVVRWLKAEQKAGRTKFRITARRAREVEEMPLQDDYRLGDAEREELSEVATTATLDIEPIRANEGWRLSVVVEDEIGPRISGRQEDEEGEQQIDLATFYEEFILPGRGTTNVIAEVQDAAAQATLSPLLRAIEENRHEAEEPPSKK